MSGYENQIEKSELIIDSMESFINGLGHKGLTYDLFISSGPIAKCELNLEYHSKRLVAEITAQTISNAQLAIVAFCDEANHDLSDSEEEEEEGNYYNDEEEEFNAYFAEKQKNEHYINPCENCLGEDCCCCEYFLEGQNEY